MSMDEVLARVDRDLSRGHTHLAMQRLASLTVSFPHDLEIRERRAALNRQIGNLPEAGRWGFLTETVEPAEIAAFERAHPRAWDRLHLVRLRADPTKALGPLALAIQRGWVVWCLDSRKVPLTCEDVGVEASIRRESRAPFW